MSTKSKKRRARRHVVGPKAGARLARLDDQITRILNEDRPGLSHDNPDYLRLAKKEDKVRGRNSTRRYVRTIAKARRMGVPIPGEGRGTLLKLEEKLRTTKRHKVGAGKRLGVHGCVLAPSPHFPGESCLSCPKCGGTDITLTGAHGPGGRLGDPGGHSWAQCGSCGWRSALEPVKW